MQGRLSVRGASFDQPPGYDCKHYRRRCSFVSPCCKKIYICRICHNENEKHEINRHAVAEVKCLMCSEIQPVAKSCIKCGIIFGAYFCAICRLYDDEDKKQFHCAKCGICRVGGKENFFHCDVCNSCLMLTMKNTHKCVHNASHSNCPICLEDIHTSRTPVEVPRCGHFIHTTCFSELLKHSTFACPLCGESYKDMTKLWNYIDKEIACTPMPDEYKDFEVVILCKDCHKVSHVLFHVLGLKCQIPSCGSYNTCRSANDVLEKLDLLPNETGDSHRENNTQEPSSEESAEDLLHV